MEAVVVGVVGGAVVVVGIVVVVVVVVVKLLPFATDPGDDNDDNDVGFWFLESSAVSVAGVNLIPSSNLPNDAAEADKGKDSDDDGDDEGDDDEDAAVTNTRTPSSAGRDDCAGPTSLVARSRCTPFLTPLAGLGREEEGRSCLDVAAATLAALWDKIRSF